MARQELRLSPWEVSATPTADAKMRGILRFPSVDCSAFMRRLW